MKVGDLVRLKTVDKDQRPTRVGVVIEFIQKKCWRTQEMGTKVNWDVIELEPHGVVMYDNCSLDIPLEDLETIEE
jgi:hypothetical protein